MAKITESIVKGIRKIKDPGSHGHKRSDEWPKVRAEHLKKHPKCAACGGDKKLNVHHIVPFHDNPELELEPSNFITLCVANKWLNCHLCIGHIGSFKNDNPNVVKDAEHMKEMLKR